MTGEAWRRHLETYVALRRAVGFAMRREARVLQDFVEHLERRGPDAPVGDDPRADRHEQASGGPNEILEEAARALGRMPYAHTRSPP